MITIENIKTAIENQQALLKDGDEMSYETLLFFQEQSGKNKKILFEDFRTEEKRSPVFHVRCTCPVCGEEFTFCMTKTKFTESKRWGISLFTYFNGISPHGIEGSEFKDYLKSKIKENNPLPCIKCCNNLKKELDDVKSEFYDHPLIWINTHNPDEGGWQWRECTKLIKYPSNFKNIPEGFIYCGVHYRDRYNHIIRSSFDANYIQWKEIKEKTTIERNPSSVKQFVEDVLRTHPLIDDPYNSRKKSVEIAENFLDGLLSGTDLSVLLDYVGTEIGKIQKRISVPPVPTHVFKFGKYKGYDVHRIIEIDRDYITWALEKVEDFIMSEEEWKHYRGEEWHRLEDLENTSQENDSENVVDEYGPFN